MGKRIEACKNCAACQVISGSAFHRVNLPNGGVSNSIHIITGHFCFFGRLPDTPNRFRAVDNYLKGTCESILPTRRTFKLGEPRPLQPVGPNFYCHEFIDIRTRS